MNELMDKIKTILQNGKGGKPCVFSGDITFNDGGDKQTFKLCYVSRKRVYQRLVKDTAFDETIFYYLRSRREFLEAINGYYFFTLTNINLN